MGSSSHEQRNWLPAYTITLCAAATILLWIRLLSRWQLLKCQQPAGRFGIDDLFIALAWALSMAWGALIVLSAVKYGLNRHVWDVPPDLWGAGAKISFQIEVLFFFATCFAKISVLLFYRRLVAGTYSTTYKWILWCSIGFVVIYTITFFAVIYASCIPIEALWRKYDPTYTTPYRCTSPGQAYSLSIVIGALSVVSDLYSVLLPTLLLFSLSISVRQKVGLMFIFGAGFLVVAAGCVRTYYLVRVESSNIDKTWNGFNVFVAGIAELNLGIMCACAPSVQHFFKDFFRNLAYITGQSSSQSGSGSARSGTQSQGNGKSQRSEMSRITADSDVERWTADSRKYRSTSIPDTAHPGTMYIHDDESGLEEDWTNSSKLVV